MWREKVNQWFDTKYSQSLLLDYESGLDLNCHRCHQTGNPDIVAIGDNLSYDDEQKLIEKYKKKVVILVFSYEDERKVQSNLFPMNIVLNKYRGFYPIVSIYDPEEKASSKGIGIYVNSIPETMSIQHPKTYDIHSFFLNNTIFFRSYPEKEDIFILYNKAMEKNAHILNRLNELMKSCQEHIEGNLFYPDHEWYQFVEISELFAEKRYNLFELATTAANILEIGFNAGHSCFLQLIANPISQIQIFDDNRHSYTKKCFQYLDVMFPGRLNMILGDSTKMLPNFLTYRRYDLIHIDGGHDEKIFSLDLENCKQLATKNSLILIDDYWIPNIGKTVDSKVSQNLIKRFTLPYETVSKYGILHVLVKFLK
jgi:hypothetical protein